VREGSRAVLLRHRPRSISPRAGRAERGAEPEGHRLPGPGQPGHPVPCLPLGELNQGGNKVVTSPAGTDRTQVE
jgi:hypothetical protein